MQTCSQVFINGRFLSQRVTGIQRYSREMLAALDDLLLASPGVLPVQWVLLVPEGVELPPLKHIKSRVLPGAHGHLWEQWQLYRASRKGLLLNFGSTGPMLHFNQLITIHDASVCQVPDAFSWKFRLWYRFLLSWIGRTNRSVLAVSEFAKSEVAHWFKVPRERIVVTQEGWQHLNRIVPVSSEEIRTLVGDKPYVLAVSSPTPNKNFQLVVKAIEQLGTVPYQFVVAGGLNPRVFSISQQDVPGVRYLGYVSDEQLKALYQGALCFVFPSRYEGFGIPPLEAMSFGCPVLASSIPSVQEVCADAAVYFDPNNASELAEKLSAVTSSSSIQSKLKQDGLARVSNYSWTDAAGRVLAHIKERL